MRYKRSKYNVEIDRLKDGGVLLYNTYTGAFGIMDSETKVLFEDIERIDISAIDNPKNSENIKKLIRFGYVVSEQVDELATFELERAKVRLGSTVLSLTIAPTMACNMRCPYCYENKNGKKMSKETQEKLIQFVKAHFSNNTDIKRLSITWYGGEPLLQMDTIHYLSKSFMQICKDNKCEYKARIVTNGVLLDKETAKVLHEECNVNHAQITIDGMPEFHNKRRILVDGTGSFDLIIKNIEECRSILNISIRMNIDKTNEDQIDQFMQFAIKKMKWEKNPKIYIAPVDYYTESCAHAASTCFGRVEFAEIQNKFLLKNYAIDRTRTIGEFFPHRSAIHCGAERQNNYVIDPEGYFYNCWMQIGDKDHCSGHIDNPFLITNNHYKWLSCETPQKCKECVYLPLCAGGCGYFRIVCKGEPNCKSSFYGYKETLRMAYYDYRQQKLLKSN